MIIQRATIFGFGKWVNETFDFSEQQVTYVYGENESGKSTLHAFLLFMLFGFPPKQCEFYRPKTSGQIGGRLTISQGEETFMIERLHNVRNGEALIYTSDGEQKGEAWLKEQLKGMTLATYQSVFSFSAKDLLKITEMQADDLGEVILGVGLTGAKNLYAVEKQLEQQLGVLFKPSGKKPLMNQRLTKLQDIQAQANDWKRLEATYQEKQAQVKGLEQAIEHLKKNIQELHEQRLYVDKQKHALPIIQAYHTVEKQLEQIPKEITFPEAGVERWERLKEKLLPLKSEIAVLQANQTRYRSEIKGLTEALLPVDLYYEGKLVMEEKPRYEQLTEQAEAISQSLQKQEQQFVHSCNELQLPIDRSEIDQLQLSVFTEKNWKKIKEDLDQLDVKQLQLQLDKKQQAKQRSKLMEEKQAIQERITSEQQLHDWKQQLQHSAQIFTPSSIEQQSTNQSNWKKQQQRKRKQTRLIFSVLIIAAMLLAGIGIGMDYTALLLLAPLVAIGAVFQWNWQEQSIKEMDRLFMQPTNGSYLSDTERKRVEQLVEQQLQLRTRLEAIDEQLKRIDVQALKWEEQQLQLTDQMRRMDERIIAEQDAYPFLTHLAPTYWPDIFHSLKQLQYINGRMKEDEETYATLMQQLAIIRSNINTFAQHEKWEWSEQTVHLQFNSIQKLLERHEAAANQCSYYQTQLAESELALHQVNQQMKPLTVEMNQLLETAHVGDEEAFYEKENQKQLQQSLLEKKAALASQLASFFPKDMLDAIMDKIPRLLDLEQQQEKMKQTTTQLEKDLEKHQQMLATVHAEIVGMEKREDYSTLVHQKEMEQEALHQQAKQWATLKTAKEMLLQAKRSYQNKYLHKVMERTTLYFRELTAEAYQYVYPPTAEQPFTVETNDGTRFDVKELSQGTMDQLYVALRLAVSVCISEEHALPFMMDDAFVHFDSIRTKRVTSLLERIVQRQQVIVFTCKQDLVTLAEKRSFVQMLNSIRIH
ncbi:AAA family ATPase [Virgibacillus pantothenticus]|uniref:ATP-binding protein n=1 Tax=Virgibacillus pantothenticus TaxID=1473 RepID=UPI001C2266CD|nr:AAA family ATPase [Virgibacillus pantothenticus]MBU8566895.1 AAA family ATPase [Virgibacillus pantothenticus]MBU8600412.1 AAA family ATPase [Virgibacillus pantothenticus]MBU8635192.1 AAA family ATPase [Virgibacillus pantothenticus]MBU8642614.1 AAA family ATPase [Virgibacillus pantothenticus]MBU8646698.1 AAA family ATPase [Virgibacillus pantothenticus]